MPRSYERHLDLLLAEELTCNQPFAHWFAERSKVSGLPDGDPSKVSVGISHDDTTDSSDDAGENDLLVDMHWQNGWTLRLLVEDKLDAPLQPRQVERYLHRSAYHSRSDEIDASSAIVVAPQAYLDRHADALTAIASVSIDEIANELRRMASDVGDEVAPRLRWRADRLVTLKAARKNPSPDHPPTVALRNWLIARLAEAEPSAVPNGITLRTVHSGWLYFSSPEAIVYKIQHGTVDIYLRDIWPDPVEQEAAHSNFAETNGFVAAADTKGNLILRAAAHNPVSLDQHDPTLPTFPKGDLLEGVRLCGIATRWVDDAMRSALEARSS